ncbi:MAG: bacteriohemerythrin [Thiotrichaceae bacterium]
MSRSAKMILLALFAGSLIVALTLTFINLGIKHPLPWFIIATLIALSLFSSWNEKHHFVEWKDAYSVGIESLDNDHRKLLNLINLLQTALHYPTGEEFEKQALEQVVAYTKYHFEREEKMLLEAGFADYDAHKRKHDAMINKVDEFMQDYESRGHDALEVVALFLKNWLLKHINGTDKEYTSLLQEKGFK